MDEINMLVNHSREREMTSRLKVTIGLCVKDVEATVKEAINSIVEQNFLLKNMELIVVDGYSNDKTLSIIKESLSSSELEVKYFCENNGLGFARQLVVESSSGKYIIWVDGDMILPKNFVTEQVKFIESNPKVGIGKARYGFLNQKSMVAILENMQFVIEYYHVGKTEKPVGTSGCIYNVNAIREIGGFSVDIKGVGEDMDVEYRMRAAGWPIYVTPALFYEKRRETWKDLWAEYVWHGSGAHFLSHKNSSSLGYRDYLVFPIIILSRISDSIKLYKLTRMKVCFLLLLHYGFKRIAWLCGFLKSHMESNGHFR